MNFRSRFLSILPALVLGLGTLIGGQFVSLKLVEESKDVARIKLESTEPLLFANRFMDADEWTINPFVKRAQKKALEDHERILSEAEEVEKSIAKHSWIIIWLAVALMGITAVLYIKSPHFAPAVIIAMSCAAMLFLRLGVDSPALEIQAYHQDLTFPVELSGRRVYEELKDENIDLLLTKIRLGDYLDWVKDISIGFDQHFQGRIYYQYQTKSIIESIELLFNSGNDIVAVCILLFSVIFPLLKLIVNLWIAIIPRVGKWKVSRALVYLLAKWSMADVFVVALLLAYLSLKNMEQGVTVTSEVKLGFYFFLAYVLVSMISGMITQYWSARHYAWKDNAESFLNR